MRALLDPLNVLIACCVLAGTAVLVTGVGAVLELWRDRHDARTRHLRHARAADTDAAPGGADASAPEEADETGPWHRPRPFVRHEPTGEAPTDLVRITAAPLAEAAEAVRVADAAPLPEAAELPPVAVPEPVAASAGTGPRAEDARDARDEPVVVVSTTPTTAGEAPAPVRPARPATVAAAVATEGQPSHVRLVPSDAPTSPRRPLAARPAASAEPGAPVPSRTSDAGGGLRIDAPTAAEVAGAATTPVIDLAEERARRTGQHAAVVVDDEELSPATARHPSSGGDAPAGRRKLPRGAEAALQSILEIRPDPRNTLALQRDPTAEVRLTEADRSAARRRHGRSA